MSESFRIQGPGGASEAAGAKKDKTVGPNDFKKYMVEEVKDIDPHQKRHRRRRQEEQDEIEEEAKKAMGPGPSAKTSIEQVGGPASKKAGTAPTAPLSSSAPSSTTTPFAEFQAESIEEYAWQEDMNSPSLSSSAPQPTTIQSSTPPPAQSPPAQSFQTPSETTYPEEASLYTPSETEQISSPPEYEYSTQDYEGSVPSYLREQPYTSPAPSSQTSDQTKESYPSKPTEEEKPRSSRKKRKPPEEIEQRPSKAAATSPKVAKEMLESEKFSLTEEQEPSSTKAARKKGKPPPMLGEVEKRSKEAPVEFKKLMEEKPVAAPEEENPPGEETVTQAATRSKKGARRQPSGRTGDKTPLPALEKTSLTTPSTTAPIHGAIPSDLSSTKKTTTDKLPSKKPREQEEPTEVEEEGLAIPPLAKMTPSAQGEAGGEKRQREPGEWGIEPTVPPTPLTSTTTPIAQQTTGVASTSPYAELHPEILDLFERLVGVMTVMQTAGISETTMTLSEKAFANSSLLGASITIRTYDIAPKEMNIEFTGSAQAIAQMQQNLPSLMAAFQAGNYNFVIKRFDFKIGAAERPLFRRKEELRERGSDQQQNEEERS